MLLRRLMQAAFAHDAEGVVRWLRKEMLKPVFGSGMVPDNR